MKKLLTFALVFSLLAGLLPALPQVAAEENVFAAATWNKGAYYATADPDTSKSHSRRYTVIDCRAGDVFSVTIPRDNWQIFVYPADADGSIDGTWAELKEDAPYTVTAIGDRTPTCLRITVCPPVPTAASPTRCGRALT